MGIDLGLALHDPLWHLTLWVSYHGGIESDIVITGRSPKTGAINAALLLADFVSESLDRLHINLHA